MRDYEREEELEDEYYDDYVDEEEQEEGEEEYEEEDEERSQPTKEELEYLGLRERIKASIRKQMKREHGSSSSGSPNKRQKLPYDNYGSFFGPSKPVIAQRVIQESKSLLENHHLTSRNLVVQNTSKKSSTSSAAVSRPVAHGQVPRVTNELKMKVQKLKDTRDYSFLLSDDAETSTPGQDPRRQNVSAPHSDTRSGGSAQVQMNRKPPLGNSSRHMNNAHEERRPVSSNGQMHTKVAPKLTSASKLSSTSADPRRQLGSKSGNGPGRPVGQQGLPLKKPVATMEKVSTPGMRNSVPGLHKPSSSKLPSSVQRQYLEQTRGRQEPNKGKIIPKQPVASSKHQINKPLRPNPQPRATMQDTRMKKPVRRPSDDLDDPDNALAMIRNMFKYDPNKYAGDDDDDSDMEANFADILREEKRSARIARKEDEEELRKIEEEERRELLAKKKRKMAQR